MDRVFLRSNELELRDDDYNHIIKSLRNGVGDCIEIVFGKEVILAKIVSVDKKCAKLEKIKSHIINEEQTKIHLIQGCVEKKKWDFIFNYATQSGIVSFTPMTTEYMKEYSKKEINLERSYKIIRDAAMQSKSYSIPIINEAIDFDDIFKRYDKSKLFMLDFLGENISRYIDDIKKCDEIFIVVGPEGGFSDNEKEKAKKEGINMIKLHDRVLRTELAGLAISNIIKALII